jgi:hydroxyacylglutathione hydrolase
MLIHSLTVAPIGTNCFVLACEKTGEAIMIDPGGEPDRILALVDEKQYRLQYIINTHAHFDHVGAVADIKIRKQVPFYLHKDDAVYLEPTVFRETLASFGFHHIQPPTVDAYIDPSHDYTFGELSFKVLETPGHSPGGVCFLFEKDVFVGDTLFAGSIGRTDFPGGSMSTLMESIRTRLMCLADDTVVHCGHMGQTTIGHERRHNPFSQYWT